MYKAVFDRREGNVDIYKAYAGSKQVGTIRDSITRSGGRALAKDMSGKTIGSGRSIASAALKLAGDEYRNHDFALKDRFGTTISDPNGVSKTSLSFQRNYYKGMSDKELADRGMMNPKSFNVRAGTAAGASSSGTFANI